MRVLRTILGVIAATLAVGLAGFLVHGFFDAGTAVDDSHRRFAGRRADPDLTLTQVSPAAAGLAVSPRHGRAPSVAGRSVSTPGSDRQAPAPYEVDEVLVADPPAHFWSAAAADGLRLVSSVTLPKLGLTLHRLRLPAADRVAARIETLRGRFPRLLVDANHHYRIAGEDEFSVSYGRALIGWNNIPADCGRGAVIGMIDAGIDAAHPALVSANLTYRSFHRAGRRPGAADHGTAIAALLAGSPGAGRGWGGLVPGAHLNAANVFEYNGNGDMIATAGALLEAVEWMVERKVPIINISLAGPDNRIVRTVVAMARDWGLVLVAAAGNGGAAALPAFPAAYSDVIAVTAVEADRTIYEHANRGHYVEFAAPGVRVWTAVPDGGRYQSGTSFATPYVSAVAALTGENGEPAGLEAVREELRLDAVDLGPAGRDDMFGWGMVTTSPRCGKPVGSA